MINSGGAGHKMIRKPRSEDNEFCDWIQRPSKYLLEPQKFDRVAIAEQELSILMSRQEKQEDFIRHGDLAELTSCSDVIWDNDIDRADYDWQNPRSKSKALYL